MATMVPNAIKAQLLQYWIDNLTQARMMLLDDNHTQNPDTQSTIDAVSGNEVTGTGYTAEGATVSGLSVSTDNTNDRGELTFNNVQWDATGGSLSARYVVLYDDTGTPSTSNILIIWDLGSLQTANDDTFTISPDAEGGVQVT